MITGTTSWRNYSISKVDKLHQRQAINHNISATEKEPVLGASFEEFICAHYYGYTKFNASNTEEYQVQHLSWEVNKITEYK